MTDIPGLIRPALHIFAADEWTALNVILTGIVAVGIVYGYYSLKEMARNQRLSAARLLYEELEKTENERREIIKKIGSIPNIVNKDFNLKNLELSVFTDEDKLNLRKVINSFNRIGLLIETDTISQILVLSICYPAIIQSWAISEAYANDYQKKIGVPYARRVQRLSKMAENYFDSNPKNWENEINLVMNDFSKQIYRTNKQKGINSLFQHLTWTKMRITKNYSVI